MSALQCLLHMAPLHAHVYDGSSPPIPGAGYDALETSQGTGSFAALLCVAPAVHLRPHLPTQDPTPLHATLGQP